MFRQWYLDMAASSMEEPFSNAEFHHYLQKNSILKFDSATLDKRTLDELTSEFVGSYCDLTDDRGEILELFGSCCNKWRYEKSTAMVVQTADRVFINLWNYIIVQGRSLYDNRTFEGLTDDMKIGFLTYNERRTLQKKIEVYFGTIEQMREQYWTDIEKKALQEVMVHSKDSSYPLLGQNPISSGLEYVLAALIEMTDHQNEVISVIE